MNEAMVGAIGNALTLLTSLLQRQGALDMARYGELLALVGTVDAEARPEESQILCAWAAMIQDVAEDIAGGERPH